MGVSSIDEIVAFLREKREFLRDRYGVTRIGIFGSFLQGNQNIASDIDMVIEFERNKKNFHSFFQVKRFLEKEFSREVDMGFESALKPVIREKIREKSIYV
jgi:predicted nucleotidyltransferase